MKLAADTLLARAVRVAVGLPAPAQIARTILAASTGAHNGLRAATYDARTRGTGHDVVLTHPERLAEQRIERAKDNHRPAELDHLRDLSKSSQRFVDAIATISGECHGAQPPETWEEALTDANLLVERGIVTAALDVGRDLDAPIRRACDAVATILALHQRYNQRTATPWERYKRNGGRADEICEIHAALTPPIFKAKHGKPQLCKTCADLTRTAGQRPPVELIRLLERGGQIEYRNARSRWLSDCGVHPETQGA